jgi:O-antigen/teichoic acid export membrane protein
MSGVPTLLFLTMFMLLGGQILRLVCGDYYRHGAGILMLLSAAKVATVCSGFYGLVIQMTGHHKQMLQVSRLTRPLFIVGALLVGRDYGSMGAAAEAAVTTVLRNVVMVLTAKMLAGMLTDLSFSLSNR